LDNEREEDERMCFAGGQSLDKMITQYGKAGCPHIGRERIKAGLIKLAEWLFIKRL